MEYNLNEGYNKKNITKEIGYYLTRISQVDSEFNELSKKERDMIKYHILTGLCSYLTSCCYTFIKEHSNLKSAIEIKFVSLQKECEKLKINDDLKHELIEDFKTVLAMVKTME
jgi:hypothetical protein